MPSYPLSQFSDLEEMMCKVNRRGGEKERRESSAWSRESLGAGDAKLVDVC